MAKKIVLKVTKNANSHIQPVNTANIELKEMIQHIENMDQLIEEMEQKIGHSSSCDVTQQQLRQQCYDKNITEMRDGYTVWNNKITNAEKRLRENLQHRWNIKNKLESLLNELSDVTQSLTSTAEFSNSIKKGVDNKVQTSYQLLKSKKSSNHAQGTEHKKVNAGSNGERNEVLKETKKSKVDRNSQTNGLLNNEKSKKHAQTEAIDTRKSQNDTATITITNQDSSSKFNPDVVTSNPPEIKDCTEQNNSPDNVHDICEPVEIDSSQNNLADDQQDTNFDTSQTFLTNVCTWEKEKECNDSLLSNKISYCGQIPFEGESVSKNTGNYSQEIINCDSKQNSSNGISCEQPTLSTEHFVSDDTVKANHLCHVSTQTDFSSADYNSILTEVENFTDRETFSLQRLKRNKLLQQDWVPNNYVNIHLKTKQPNLKLQLSRRNVSPCPMLLGKPSPQSNIYQTMATNSDYKSFSVVPSGIKNNTSKYNHKSSHAIIYHCKELDDFLSEYKKDAIFYKKKHDYNVDTDSDNPYFNNRFTNINDGQNIKIQYPLASDLGSVNKESQCFGSKPNVSKNSSRRKKTSKIGHSHNIDSLTGSIDSNSACQNDHLPDNNGLPFSFCPDSRGGRWKKMPQISSHMHGAIAEQTVSKKRNTKQHLSKKDSRKLVLEKEDIKTLETIMTDSPGITPISVRIIRRKDHEQVGLPIHGKLKPIAQKVKPTKRHPVRYPISPKYRKPRNYCSAFMRKKKLQMKHIFDIM